MAEQISPISQQNQINQLLGEDFLSEAATSINPSLNPASGVAEVKFSGNIFDDFLSQAVKALDGISQSEIRANQLIDKYIKGEVELHEVMTAQAKMSVEVQFAVTAITQAVTTFKEITQMQV